jgi:hypothetical protein
VLDRLEPLQYGPDNKTLEGELKDRTLADLLQLSWDNPGLCLITTRVLVEDIRDMRMNAAAVIELDHLSDQAGGALLKVMGIEGETKELEAASRKVQGHGLALNLLATYLRDFCRSDIRRINEVDFFEPDLKRGSRPNGSWPPMSGPLRTGRNGPPSTDSGYSTGRCSAA